MTTENERLNDRVRKLEEDAAFDEDENEEERSFLTRRDLINQIRVLETDCVDTLSYGFNTAVEQLQIVIR